MLEIVKLITELKADRMLLVTDWNSGEKKKKKNTTWITFFYFFQINAFLLFFYYMCRTTLRISECLQFSTLPTKDRRYQADSSVFTSILSILFYLFQSHWLTVGIQRVQHQAREKQKEQRKEFLLFSSLGNKKFSLLHVHFFFNVYHSNCTFHFLLHFLLQCSFISLFLCFFNLCWLGFCYSSVLLLLLLLLLLLEIQQLEIANTKRAKW